MKWPRGLPDLHKYLFMELLRLFDLEQILSTVPYKNVQSAFPQPGKGKGALADDVRPGSAS